MTRVQQIAPGVFRFLCGFVNVFFLGSPGDTWVLVDAAVAGDERQIARAAEQIYGERSRPKAILLTHGHGDHAGSAGRLSELWDVPVYAHKLERPYLTGLCDYPPMDPTIGGFAGFASRFVPMARVDLGARLIDLSDDGSLPSLNEWKWLRAPGHTPGHAVFYRENDGVLIAGDSLTTLRLNSAAGNLIKKKVIQGPPEATTTDWPAAEATVRRLALLNPSVLGCGHGSPLEAADDTATRLRTFAALYAPPKRGRYVNHAPTSDETGVVSLPPAPLDPIRPVVAGVALVSVAVCAWLFARRSKIDTNRSFTEGDSADDQDNM
jgi:glyoxylase-like metal-dependent hydrolase (beta-lactamase superfamily II)